MWHGAHMAGFMGFGWIVPGLILAGILYFFFVSKNKKSPKELLDERFAKGEIDKNEYEEARKILEKSDENPHT